MRAINSDFTSHRIQAVTIKEVSRKFKHPIIHVNQISHLETINDLTEDYSAAPKYATVELLLGNPHSLILAPDQTIVGPTEDLPIAVKTKLGTCLSGNLNSDRKMASYNTATKEPTTVNIKANTENSDNAHMNTTEVATKLLPTQAKAEANTDSSDNASTVASKDVTVETAKDQPQDEIDSLMEDAKQVYQPLTFTQNADQRWMDLQYLAIDP